MKEYKNKILIRLILISTIILLFFSFSPILLFTKKPNNYTNIKNNSINTDSFELLSVEDIWNKETKSHDMKVLFDGEFPTTLSENDGPKYDIIEPEKSSSVFKDGAKLIGGVDIKVDGKHHYFNINIKNEDLKDEELLWDNPYNFKIMYGSSKYQEVSFYSTFKPLEFRDNLREPKPTITSHSILLTYNYTQANNNAYKNTKTKITLWDDKDNKKSDKIIDEKIIGTTKKDKDTINIFFDDLNENSQYWITKTNNNNVNKEDKQTLEQSFITGKKQITFQSKINFSKEKYDDVDGYYSWWGNDKYSKRVDKVKLELYEKESKESKVLISTISSPSFNSEKGKFKFSFKNDGKFKKGESIKPGTQYCVQESVKYHRNIKWTILKNYDTETIMKDTTAEVTSSVSLGSNLSIEVKLNDITKFKKNSTDKFKIKFSDSSLNKYTVTYQDGEKSETYKRGSEFYWSYVEIENINDFVEMDNDSATFSLQFNGLPWNGEKLIYTTSLEGNDEVHDTTSDFKNDFSFDPSSLSFSECYHNDNKTYSYKIKWNIKNNPDEIKDFSKKIYFSNKIKNNFSKPTKEEGISVMDEKSITSLFGKNDSDNYLYLSVSDRLVNKKRTHKLDFLTNRYLVFEEDSPANSNYQNLFYINSYVHPFPYLIFMSMFIAILLVMLVLIGFFIYNTSSKKRYAHLKTYSKNLYNEMEKQYKVYGINSKAEDYINLIKMDDTNLNNYIDNMNINLPEGLTRKEKIDIASLLTESEILFINDLIEYELSSDPTVVSIAKKSFKGKKESWIDKEINKEKPATNNENGIDDLDDGIVKEEEVIDLTAKRKRRKKKEYTPIEQTEEQILIPKNPYEETGEYSLDMDGGKND